MIILLPFGVPYPRSSHQGERVMGIPDPKDINPGTWGSKGGEGCVFRMVKKFSRIWHQQ